MKTTTRLLIGAVLVVGFGLGWAVKIDHNVVEAHVDLPAGPRMSIQFQLADQKQILGPIGNKK